MVTEHLIVLPASGRPFSATLSRDVTLVGSGRDAHVRIADPELAGVHAEIRRTQAGLLLVRHASPLQVNGRKVRQHPLTSHDLIAFGRTAMSLRPGPPADEPAGAVASDGAALSLIRRLNDFTRSMERERSADDLAQELLADVLSLVGGSHGAIVRLAGDEVDAVSIRGASTALSRRESECSRTLIARMLDTGEPILVRDATTDSDLATARSIHDAGARSVICAPIHDGGRIVGALYISDPRQCFSETALQLVTFYARHAVHIATSKERNRRLTAQLAEAERSAESGRLVGSSPAMCELRARMLRVAVHDIPVLLLGETGTGKEVVAREIHRLSARAARPFVVVHCGAIPAELLQSELFGHKKGAFTHAGADRAGRIRSAEGGTLFLDEIGEMPAAQQVMLLRVLQDGRITPVGEDREYPVDFRLVCATHRDLERDVAEGRFRQDLYFRIAGVCLNLPPLRERESDVLELAQLLLRRHRTALARPDLRLSAAALAAVRAHRWDGNVRELEAAVRKAAVLCDTDAITPADLDLSAAVASPGEEAVARPLYLERDRYLKQYVQRVVDSCGGHRGRAAELLMVSPRTVFKYLEET